MFFSLEFWLFTTVVLIVYNFLATARQNLLLLVASYLIYFYFSRHFLFVLILLTTISFFISHLLVTQTHYRRLVLLGGISINLIVLILFKPNASLLPVSNATSQVILLPMGISFYTLRVLSYLFDVYARRIKPTSSWINLATYVAFFPQMPAGPIERAGTFLSQLGNTRRLNQQQFVIGLTYIFIGFFYKVAIANPLSPATDAALSTGLNSLSSTDALAVLILYSIRLYTDFAGYSAIAIGISIWFGLPAMENFRQPYFAPSVVNFWTRWHISLSSWFRDYFFYPFSRLLIKRFGGKYVSIIQNICMTLTMLLTGLWHGVTLPFAVWGLLHGGYMIIERFLKDDNQSPKYLKWQSRLIAISNVLITQLLVSIGWIFFATSSLEQAGLFFQKLFAPEYAVSGLWWPKVLTPLILVLFIDAIMSKGTDSIWHWHPIVRTAVFTIMSVAIFLMGTTSYVRFIYEAF